MGALAQTRPDKSGRSYSCKVDQILADADDDDRNAVAEVMADTTRSTRSIALWLGVSENTASKHRFGACQCSRRG